MRSTNKLLAVSCQPLTRGDRFAISCGTAAPRVKGQLLARGGRRLPARSDSSSLAPRPSPLAPGGTRCRLAFSLLELMVAIIILGIGMVMVATVFPIGIDIAAQNVQTNISQSAVETAMATLETRVPVYAYGSEDVDGDPIVPFSMVLAPDVAATDLDTQIDNNDAIALTQDGVKAGVAPPLGWLPPGGQDFFIDYGPPPNGLGIASVLPAIFPAGAPKLRAFTEWTGWAGEVPWTGWIGQPEPWNYAFVVPSQNMPPAFAAVTDLSLLPSTISPTFGPQPNLWCLSLVDRVYPPVSLTRRDGSPRPFLDAGTEMGIRSELAQRRYSWIAVHHRGAPSAGSGRFTVTIIVTYRSDLNARYARQADLDTDPAVYNPLFDISNPAVVAEITNPAWPMPDADSTTDMLFPQPWLVRFQQVNPASGEILCGPKVAELLPSGSWFVIAQTAGNPARTVLSQELAVGKPFEVMGRSVTSAGTILTIRRTNEQVSWNDVYVWVVPPAIERVGSNYTFRAKSPVAGVAMRILN